MKNKYYSLFISIIMWSTITWAQRPREIQVDNEPTDWSNPWNIALCIVVPILLILGGIYIQKRAKKRN
ncbi:hypothetical protein [Crocinitomix algicola]|uniref:hypothetical protein n=1 Tax=Crocinitomix algicola TaxID=1740263 RepID=UPI001112E9A7|nr:hypothetical protein [Crocinitomix algicola]